MTELSTLGYAWVMATLPPMVGWKIIQAGQDGYAIQSADGLRVIVSGRVEADGRRWLHVSLSRAGRLPGWEDLTRVKRLIVGPARYAYQVFPSEEMYVNLNPHVLHLWACWDVPGGAVLPEFSGTLPDGRRTI